MPQAVSILTFVDHVERDAEGFREQYDRLSEFAHRNWAGTTFLYSRLDPRNFRTDFGTNIRGVEGPKQVGAGNLGVAPMFFEQSYNRIADLMPAFIELRKGG